MRRPEWRGTEITWNKVLIAQLTVTHPVFQGSRRFVSVFTTADHLSPPHPTPHRVTLIQSTPSYQRNIILFVYAYVVQVVFSLAFLVKTLYLQLFFYDLDLQLP